MNRVTLLALVGAVLAAGCVGGLGPSTGAGPTPTNATDSPTTTTEPLPDRTLTLPDGPKERPGRPVERNRSSVRAYVHDFQYRYAYNGLWYSEYSDVNLECSVESVAEYAEGYNATVSCTGYSNTRGPTEDGTVTELHADYFTQVYTYYVDRDSTIRTRADGQPDGWQPSPTPVEQPTPTGGPS